MVAKPTAKSVRNKCDKLLTPIIKKMYSQCLLCGNETQVAHHFCHKSKSTRLRYELENLIPLCYRCHLALHHNESYHASRIIAIKGLEWFKDLEKKKNETVKADVYFYLENYKRLSKLL